MPGGNNIVLNTSPAKAEPIANNGPSPIAKIMRAPTPPSTIGVKPTINPSIAMRPTLNQPHFQVPMVRAARSPMIMQPVRPPGTKFQNYVIFADLTLDYFSHADGDLH
jgi:hypothetical protein